MSQEIYNPDSLPTLLTLAMNGDGGVQVSDSLQPNKNYIIQILPECGNGTISYTVSDSNELFLNPDYQTQPSLNTIVLTDMLKTVDTIEPQPLQVENKPPEPPTPLYKCPKCSETFEKVAMYRKHMLDHANSRKYKCEKCSAGYNVESNLKIHMAMHTDGKPACPICNISFQRVASLKSHLMIHQVEELFPCYECGAEYDKEEDLNKHIHGHKRTNRNGNGMICSYCNVKFDNQKQYKEHISHHVKLQKLVVTGHRSRKTNRTKDYPHVCPTCSKSFSRASLLERHLRVHSGEKPFKCHQCTRSFNQKGTLNIHLMKHSGRKPFHCTLCSAQFNQKGNLRVHVEKTHTAPSPGVRTYKCSHCACIFKKIASLNVHVTRVHANESATVIDQLKELEQQTRGVEGVDPKEGSDVGRTVYVRVAESFLDGTVKRHLVKQRQVNDTRFYICHYCSRKFKKPSDLIRHLRIHTREKPFSCKQCGASFSLKTTLFSHTKTHITNNNYSCVVCGKKFSSVRAVTFHLKKHSQSETQSSEFKCSLCSCSFGSLQEARAHRRESHVAEASTIQFMLKQPLIHTPNGLLPIEPPKVDTTIKQFQCNICNCSYTKLSNLRRHTLTHSGGRKFRCQQCPKAYYTAYALREHEVVHSGKKVFECKQCGKQFATGSVLKRHLLIHSNHKPFVCAYCDKNFRSAALCRKHINTHKEEVEQSDENLNKTDQLLLNDLINGPQEPMNSLKLINIDKENSLMIPENDNNAVDAQSLYEISPNTIQLLATPEKETQDPSQIQTILINCDDLQLSDNLYPQLKGSESVFFTPAGDPNVFGIYSLNSEFDNTPTEMYNPNQIFNINQIINEEPKEDPKRKLEDVDTIADNVLNGYSTDLNLLLNLGEEFDTNDLPNENLTLPDMNLEEVPLNEEKLSEEEPEEFSCDHCGKSFETKNGLNRHLKTHNKTKKTAEAGRSHICSFCKKEFKKHSDLIRHIRTHTGEKPFCCDQCDKKFTLKSTLLSHQRTHNPIGHKQHNCVVCNSFFTSKSSLKVHMNLHTGVKPHSCTFCPTKFRTAAHRKTHEAIHHSNTPKKRKVTSLLASVAEQITLTQADQLISNADLDNVLVSQEPLQLPLNILDSQEPMILPSNFFLQDQLLPPSLIQLDDGTLLNIKPITEDFDPGEQPVKKIMEKPRNLECDVCHKKYASKDVLRKHKKIHGVNRRFPCTKCDKGFDMEEELVKHQKTHDGIRPYSCLHCSNTFSKEQSLATHLKRMHQYQVTIVN